MRIYLNEKEIALLLEALDMLAADYDQEERQHPELPALEKIADKLRRKLSEGGFS